jgi:hypothetical protein
MKVQFVVARFNEDVAWTNNLPCLIYDKSDHCPDEHIPLQNIGREAHTYLHHIVNNYHDLAEVTIFCQGSPFHHCPDFLEQTKLEVTDYRPYGSILTCTNKGLPHAFLRLLPQFHKWILGTNPPPSYDFVSGANFGVVKDLITVRPLPFWENALQLCCQFNENTYLKTTGSPWMFERLWQYIFTTDTSYPKDSKMNKMRLI